MNKLAWILFVALQAMATLALATNDVVLRDPDGVVVTYSDLEAEFMRAPPEIRKSLIGKPENVKRTALNIYLRRVLAAKAVSEQLDRSDLAQTQLRHARERVLAELRVQKADGEPPEEGALEALARTEYNAHPERYEIKEEIVVEHLLVGEFRPEGRKLAEELRQQLLPHGGQSLFRKLAMQYSDDPASKAKGGELAPFGRGKMVKQFEEAAFALTKPGDISDIVETDYGWHIIRLVKHTLPGVKPFDDVKTELKRELLLRVRDARRKALAEPLEAAASFDEEAISSYIGKAQ
jgi:peptidyl-prolyl cis-trans isomerase C